MNRNVVLTTMSLIAIFLTSLHLTDDVVYGADKSATTSAVIVAILVIWLYGTVVLGERAAGYAVMLLGSLAGIVVFVAHVTVAGGLPAGTIARSSGEFFFVWTLLALAATSVLSAVLSVRGLLALRRSKASKSAPTRP